VACRHLLNRLKSKHVRCAVVKFARYHTKNAPPGGESDGPVLTRQTRVVPELTIDKDLIEAALDTVAAEGAPGGTHTAAGIDLAIQTLTNAWPVESDPKDVPVRHMVLVTDGIPTLPVENGETQETGDRFATLAAAQRAADANVQTHPVVIDSVDAERRLTSASHQRSTGGAYAGGTARHSHPGGETRPDDLRGR
jgi:hypothetical protein